jgi:hypothetical protein
VFAESSTGWKSLRNHLRQDYLPYRTARTACAFLDRLAVPFVVIKRERHYQTADICRALDLHKKSPVPLDARAG